MWLYGWDPLMVSHHPAMFGGHRYCGSRDKMFWVVEEQDSICSRLNSPLQFMVWKHTAYHVNKSDTGHRKDKEITFVSLSKNDDEKEEEIKLQQRLLQSFLRYTQTQLFSSD